MKVLDLGSGSGRNSLALRTLVGQNGHMTGIDMTDLPIFNLIKIRSFFRSKILIATIKISERNKDLIYLILIRLAHIGHLIEWIRFIYISTRIFQQTLCLDTNWMLLADSSKKYYDYHTEKFGYKESHTNFVQGYIEKLREAEL